MTTQTLNASHFAAISVIKTAVEQCRDCDVRTDELIASIKMLLTHADARWPFEQLWRALANPRAEDRSAVAHASLNAILISLGLDPYKYRHS